MISDELNLALRAELGKEGYRTPELKELSANSAIYAATLILALAEEIEMLKARCEGYRQSQLLAIKECASLRAKLNRPTI